MMLDAHPEAAKSLRDKALAIVRFERKFLITSDNPVTLLPVPGADESTPLALGSNGGIWVPLARRCGLLLRENDLGFGFQADHELRGSAHDARLLNQLVANRAHKYLYHHPEDSIPSNVDVPTQTSQVGLRFEVLQAPSWMEQV